MTTSQEDFYVAGGTLPPDAPSYIPRRADEALYSGLKEGNFCYVLTSRQIGKSSIMQRTARRLAEEGFAVVTLDLTKIGVNLTVEQWYFGLLRLAGYQLRMSGALQTFWKVHADLSPLQRFFTALSECIVPQHPSGLIVFVDEIDLVRLLPFSTDEFFAAIRQGYNERPDRSRPGAFTFCLLGVASPMDLIADPRTTPFNIGTRIELSDFTDAEAGPLTEGGVNPGVLERILYWTNGHPYLTQRLCLAAARSPKAQDPAEVDRLCRELFCGSRARQEETNLAFVQNTLLHLAPDVTGILELYRRIRQGRRVPDDPNSPAVRLLCLSGLVRPHNGGLSVRNRIYAQVFDNAWIDNSLPDADRRRQKAAYWRGVRRTLILTAALLTLVGGLVWNMVRNAQIADDNARIAGNNASLYRVQRDIAQSKTKEASKALAAAGTAAEQKSKALAERQSALLKTEAALREKERQTALARAASRVAALATGQAVEAGRQERKALLSATTHLADLQAERGVQLLLQGDGTGLLDLAESCRTVRKMPEEQKRRIAFWSRWYSSCAPALDQMMACGGQVNSLQFTPDGRRVITASEDGTVRFWNRATDADEGALIHLKQPVSHLRLSPNGRWLAVSTEDSQVLLWDAVARRPVAPPIPIEDTIFELTFSPDSGQLAVAGANAGSQHGVVRFYSTSDGQQNCEPIRVDRPVGHIEFECSSRLLLVQAEKSYLFDWKHNSRIADFDPETVCAFSPDGRLAACGYKDGRICINEIANGLKERFSVRQSMPVTHLAFRPDGKRLVTGSSDGSVRFWDMQHREGWGAPLAHAMPVESLRFSHDGKILAVSSGRSVSLWDAETRTPLSPRIVQADRISGVTFSPDSASLATVGSSAARLWRLTPPDSQRRELKHNDRVQDVAFSADGRWAVTGCDDGMVRVWSMATGLPEGHAMPHNEKITAVRFTPDGKYIVSIALDWKARLWDWRAGRQLWCTPKHERDIRAFAISPDGRRVATAAGYLGLTSTVRQWDLPTGRFLCAYVQPDIAYDMAYSPDSRRLLMASGTHIFIRDAGTGRALGHALRHAAVIQTIAWSHDGRRIVTGSRDSTAQIWDAETGRAVGEPLRHRNYVQKAAFSPDDRLVATASLDGTAQLWDAATSRPAGVPMQHEGPVLQLDFMPDGAWLATGARDLTRYSSAVRLWEVPTGRPAGYACPVGDILSRLTVSPDGKLVLTNLDSVWNNRSARLWPVPDLLHTDLAGVDRRTTLLLGAQRSARGLIEPLSWEAWRRLREKQPSAR